MLDGKVVCTFVAMLVTAMAVFNVNKKNVKENFWMLPSRTWYVDKVAAKNAGAAAKGDFFSVPNYNALLSPRMSNVNYGAYIRYNPAPYQFQGVPSDPLGYGRVADSCGNGNGNGISAKEGYCANKAGCMEPASSQSKMSANYSDGNYNQVLNNTHVSAGKEYITNELPVGEMSIVNDIGEISQPIVYDRYIYANRNSRLRSQGDPIRGDLPIVPCASDWFRPSVHPNIDLHQGAMNVMGGVLNENARDLANMVYSYSGNADTTIGGVNMANDYSVSLSGGRGDIQVTSFP